MISCSHLSSHQSDRGQNLKAIIRPGESLCSAGAIATPHWGVEHFFPPSVLLNLLTPNTPTVFNYICPKLPPHLEYKCRSMSVPYLKSLCQVTRLFICSSFQLTAQVILWALFRCQAAEESCHKTRVCFLSARWPFSLDLLLLSPLLSLDHWLYSVHLPFT